MKYKIKKTQYGDVLVDESAEIKTKTNVWNYCPKTNFIFKGYVEDFAPTAVYPYPIIASINFSLDKDLLMIIIEDEAKKLADKLLEEAFGESTQTMASAKDLCKDFYIEGYKKAEETMHSKLDLVNFITFYNNYNVRKLGGYMHTTMDGSHTIHNNNMIKQIAKEYIESLEKEYIELDTTHTGLCCGNTFITQCINCSKYKPVYKIKTDRVDGQLIAYIKK